MLPSRPDASSVSAVVALSPAEIAAFFPDQSPLRALLPDAQWFDPTTATIGNWADVLNSVRPRVLVSAWRTPALPDGDFGLQYVCQLTGSVRHVVSRARIASGLCVTNWGDVAAPMVAEQALLLILGALRALPLWESFMATPFTHEDKNRLQTRSLFGRRVALHGFGRIARELVRLLRPFNVTITAFSAGVPEAFYREHGVTPADGLHALAAGADVFVSCEALTDATRCSIDRAVLSALPLGAAFVNVGRGAIVDEVALVEVARERGLRVAVDVLTHEPAPPDSPVRRLPGMLCSPHIGGPTLDCYPRCGAAALANIKRFLTGRPLNNELTLALYDRST